MPRYQFRCDKCGKTLFKYRTCEERDRSEICGDELPVENVGPSIFTVKICDGQLKRQLPVISEPTVLDTVDTHRNVKQRKDQDKRIKKRAKDFFVKHEMDETIAQVGEEQARKMGWVKPDGKKNKGD